MPSEEKYMELFGAASELAEGLIQLDGQSSPAIGFFAKRKLKKARSLFEAATKESPENAAPFLMLAKVESSLGDDDKSLDWLQKAWLLEPENLILIIELSGAYGSVNLHKEAISVLLEGLKHYPNDPRVLFNLGISFLFENQAEAAVDMFLKAVEIEPDFELNHKILHYSKEVAGGIKTAPKNHNDISKNI